MSFKPAQPGIPTYRGLLCSGCANGGGGERASFISASDQRQDTFGTGFAAQHSAFVDWTKPATDQPGYLSPEYGGIGQP